MKLFRYTRFTFIGLVLIIVFSSCTTSKRYIYQFRLEKPTQSQNLIFENDTFSISFSFNPKYIEFEIYNKSEDGIRINWDELSVSVQGEARRVIHYETGINRITDVQPPTTIPPKSKLTDGIIATNKIRWTSVSGRKEMIIPDTYPNKDYGRKKKRKEILDLKGQKVVIFFPYYIRNVFFSKTFEFLIADIIAQ